MYMNSDFEEFPFVGEFYHKTIDKTLPLDKQVEQDAVIAEVKCDIMQDSETQNDNSLQNTYSVYVPFDSSSENINIKIGCLFKGYMYGLPISGKVIAIAPSQLDGFVATVKTNEI